LFLVERPVRRTNRSKVLDIIDFYSKPKSLKSGLLRALYDEEGLSAAQIAARLGISKAAVLLQLRRNSISTKRGRENNPANFRRANPPYGYKIQDGKLVLSKSEMRVCSEIVELRGRKGLTLAATARELERLGLRKRDGTRKWHHQTVAVIFARWKNKL
jgi:hypothetical protein